MLGDRAEAIYTSKSRVRYWYLLEKYEVLKISGQVILRLANLQHSILVHQVPDGSAIYVVSTEYCMYFQGRGGSSSPTSTRLRDSVRPLMRG